MARVNRIKADSEAYYHVVTRTANKAFLLGGENRKQHMLDILRRSAEFSGVNVVTYVVMDSHIHLCVHVPERSDVGYGEVLRRVGILYGENRREALERRLSELRLGGCSAEAEAELDRLRARMGDLSEFMKTFKQRVSQWFNGEFGHEGTLWAGRFKSVLVEKGEYLKAVVHYIHLNPVRAGIVSRAADYAWSALGAASRGNASAIKGLSLIGVGVEDDLSQAGVGYRDRRLSNGVVVGSRGFVEHMGGRFAGCLRRGMPRMTAFTIGEMASLLFATHGQRSAPNAA